MDSRGGPTFGRWATEARQQVSLCPISNTIARGSFALKLAQKGTVIATGTTWSECSDTLCHVYGEWIVQVVKSFAGHQGPYWAAMCSKMAAQGISFCSSYSQLLPHSNIEFEVYQCNAALIHNHYTRSLTLRSSSPRGNNGNALR